MAKKVATKKTAKPAAPKKSAKDSNEEKSEKKAAKKSTLQEDMDKKHLESLKAEGQIFTSYYRAGRKREQN